MGREMDYSRFSPARIAFRRNAYILRYQHLTMSSYTDTQTPARSCLPGLHSSGYLAFQPAIPFSTCRSPPRDISSSRILFTSAT